MLSHATVVSTSRKILGTILGTIYCIIDEKDTKDRIIDEKESSRESMRHIM